VKKDQIFYGWKLLGILWVLYFINMGVTAYGSIISAQPMVHELGISRGMYGLAFTVASVIAALPAYFAGVFITTRGIKASFIFGSILIIAGAVVMSMAQNAWYWIIGYGVFCGVGFCFGTGLPAGTSVTMWFRRYRGRAGAILMTAPSAGGIIAAPLMGWYIAKVVGGNWHYGFLSIAGFAALSIIIAWFFVKESPQSVGQHPDGIAEDPAGVANLVSKLQTSYPWTTKEGYRTYQYWMLVLGGLGTNWASGFVIIHWFMYMLGIGFPAATAAMGLSIFAAASILGRLVSGYFLDKLRARFVYLAAIVCSVIGLFGAFNPVTQALSYSAAFFIGFGFGGGAVCGGVTMANYFGPNVFARLSGTALMVGGLIGAWSGVINGLVYDAFKSYYWAIWLAVGICLLSFVCIAVAAPPQPKSNAIGKPVNV